MDYFHVDVFTGRLFSGNPAGVCLLEAWLPAETMQAIAAENNLAETAFVVPGLEAFGLRWFTPELEMDLCGHATLAAAHVLFHHRGLEGGEARFQTKSGLRGVTKEVGQLALDFPSCSALPCDIPGDLLDGRGATPTFIAKSLDFLAVFDSEDAVRNLKPDFAALKRLGALGIIATAPGDSCDFVSRFFAPGAGVDEDPVTGSAHCTLIPYWAERLGRNRLEARQISRRGGEQSCTLNGDRVIIAGQAVTYSSGFIHLP